MLLFGHSVAESATITLAKALGVQPTLQGAFLG
jgi:hypothetical protein